MNSSNPLRRRLFLTGGAKCLKLPAACTAAPVRCAALARIDGVFECRLLGFRALRPSSASVSTRRGIFNQYSWEVLRQEKSGRVAWCAYRLLAVPLFAYLTLRVLKSSGVMDIIVELVGVATPGS